MPTGSDAPFTFDLNILERYVSEAALDAIAITNHNVFDGTQFAAIDDALEVVVFPGIEVTLDCGHILIVSDVTNLDAFKEQAEQVRARIAQHRDSISVDELKDIFRNLGEHLVIPHYDKKPAITGGALERIAEYVTSGEVDNPPSLPAGYLYCRQVLRS